MTAHTVASKNRLATEPVGRLLVQFSVPSIISMLVGAIYNIVDQIYIGHGIGFLGIAATNVAFPLTIICTACALLLGIGAAANFNLSLGAGKRERAGRFIGTALGLIGFVGVGIGVAALVFVEPMLQVFGATPDILLYALPYTRIIAIGVPFQIFATAASHLIRADGSPRFSMSIMLAGAIFNVIFDPIFLFVFDMGIAGIAWATTLGLMLSSAMGFYYLVKKFNTVKIRRRFLRPHLSYASAIFALGIASFINQLAMMVVQVVLNNTLRHYGALSVYGSEIPLAAVGAISKINVVFMAVIIGIGQGCQPINSFNYGARNYARVKTTFRYAITCATCISAAAFLVFQFFPRQVIAIFGSGTPEYVQFAVRYMRIYMLVTFANGVQPIASNFFTSIGRAKLGVIVSLTRQVLFLLPLIFTLPIFLGIEGVMFAGPMADCAALTVSIYLIRREFARMSRLKPAGEEIS